MRKLIFLLLAIFFYESFAQEIGSGNTLQFDGASTNIEYGELFNDVELPITIEAWIKVNSEGDDSRKVFFGSSWKNGVYSGVSASIGPESIAVTYGDGNGWNHPAFRRSGIANLSSNIEGRWVHVAMVVNGALDMNLYLNGIELNTSYSGTSNSPMASVGICIVGYNIADNYLKGEMDELRFWNISRSQNEIRRDMCRKVALNSSGLIGYWQFDEGAGVKTLESISDIDADILGSYEWATSGAAIGDTSTYNYFAGIRDLAKVTYGNDSLWITSESNLHGFQFYKIHEPPNSISGSTFTFDDGYYGLFPIMNQLDQEYRVDFGDRYCTTSNMRNGNDDPDWEVIMQTSDSSNYFYNENISELLFQQSGTIEPIETIYTICPGESVFIKAESNCATSYNWFDTSDDSEINISEPGTYWLERTTNSESIVEYFEINQIELNSELILEEAITVCSSDLPTLISAITTENITWNNGSSDSLISIESSGIYWVEQETSCGAIRDSIFVTVRHLEDPFIPNAITPNNDGLNDCFHVDEQILGSRLIIINRAGIRIFEDDNYQNNWCPNDLPEGVYYYHIYNNCVQTNIKGWVRIFR